MNRLFTQGELATEYRLPKHVHGQLLAEIAPVEKEDQGEPLFLEAHVDAWLNDRYAAVPGRRAGEAFLTIREVANLLLFGVRQISPLATIRNSSLHGVAAGSGSGAAVALAPFAVSNR